MARVLLNVPKTARRNEAVEVKLLISHPMESGQRRDETGLTVPRNVIHSFRAEYAGVEVLRLELHPAVAANPYLSFWFRAGVSGVLALSWVDDEGVAGTASAAVEVI